MRKRLWIPRIQDCGEHDAVELSYVLVQAASNRSWQTDSSRSHEISHHYDWMWVRILWQWNHGICKTCRLRRSSHILQMIAIDRVLNISFLSANWQQPNCRSSCLAFGLTLPQSSLSKYHLSMSRQTLWKDLLLLILRDFCYKPFLSSLYVIPLIALGWSCDFYDSFSLSNPHRRWHSATHPLYFFIKRPRAHFHLRDTSLRITLGDSILRLSFTFDNSKLIMHFFSASISFCYRTSCCSSSRNEWHYSSKSCFYLF